MASAGYSFKEYVILKNGCFSLSTMKIIYLLLFLIGLLPARGFAQKEEAILSLPDVSEFNPGEDNQIWLQQIGQEHKTIVGQSGHQQQLRIFQEGEAQQLQLFQLGHNNQWNVTQQGLGHEYTGILRGDDNQIQVLQSGSYNRLQQDLLGDGMDYQITQEGSHLELIQIENTGLAPAYQVHQQGEGMRINIENGFQALPE
jgi:minor curlin subunit